MGKQILFTYSILIKGYIMGLLPDLWGRRNKALKEGAYLRDQHNAETITALTERTAQLQQDVTVLTQQVEVLKQANADLTQGKLNLKISHDELLKQVDQLKDIEKAAEIYKRIVTELMTVHDVQLSSHIARVMMTPENLRHTVYILTQFPKWQVWLGLSEDDSDEQAKEENAEPPEVFLTKEVSLNPDSAIQTIFASSEITDDFLHNDTSDPNF